MGIRTMVTGGAGFVGSHLVARLVRQGHDVLVVDPRAEGLRGVLPERERDAVRLQAEDIRSTRAAEVARAFRPEVVFHLAGSSFVPHCIDHPLETLDANVVAFDRLLGALRPCPPRALVFTSSAAVYGYGERLAESDPVAPSNVYGLSKWLGEQLLSGFCQDAGQTTGVVARLFNPYGPGDRRDRVLGRIIDAARDGLPLELGNTWPKRDFVHVTDVVEIVLALSGLRGGGLVTVNVGTGVGTTVLELVRCVEALAGRPIPLEECPERARDDDGHVVADVTHLRQLLPSQPLLDLPSGLGRLLAAEGRAGP
jgi:UDP-glucose 4-epimerase